MDNKELTVEDIMENPKLFGLPTLEEFQRQPAFYRERFYGAKDDIMKMVDKGSEHLAAHVKNHIYKFKIWKTKSLDELDVILKDHGLAFDQLDFAPQIINMEGGKCDILVEFFEKKRV